MATSSITRSAAATPPLDHAFSSVRVAAKRDVFLEDVKDSAIAIYSRDVAVRDVERAAAIHDFAALTADDALRLADRYDLNYIVTEAQLPLPTRIPTRNPAASMTAARLPAMVRWLLVTRTLSR